MNNLVYSLLALLVFYIVLVGEFLLPTGGLLGVIAVTALTASLVFAFKFSTAAGTVSYTHLTLPTNRKV